MNFEIDSNDKPEWDEVRPVERIMVEAVRLASIPLFLLVIILSSLIYGVAILAKLVVAFFCTCYRLVAALSRARRRPVKAHDV